MVGAASVSTDARRCLRWSTASGRMSCSRPQRLAGRIGGTRKLTSRSLIRPVNCCIDGVEGAIATTSDGESQENGAVAVGNAAMLTRLSESGGGRSKAAGDAGTRICSLDQLH